MEDMSPEIKHSGNPEQSAGNEAVTSLADLLREHKGENIRVLDLRGICNWTDYFIIANVSSGTHMDGLGRHIKTFCGVNKIDILGGTGKNNGPRFAGSRGESPDDEWRLIDLGFAIIHLMTRGARDFYDLERLWTPYM